MMLSALPWLLPAACCLLPLPLLPLLPAAAAAAAAAAVIGARLDISSQPVSRSTGASTCELHPAGPHPSLGRGCFFAAPCPSPVLAARFRFGRPAPAAAQPASVATTAAARSPLPGDVLSAVAELPVPRALELVCACTACCISSNPISWTPGLTNSCSEDAKPLANTTAPGPNMAMYRSVCFCT